MKATVLMLVLILLVIVTPAFTTISQNLHNRGNQADLTEKSETNAYNPSHSNLSPKYFDYEAAKIELMEKKIELHHKNIDRQLSFIKSQKRYLQAKLSSPILE